MKESLSLALDINSSFVSLVFCRSRKGFSEKYLYKSIPRRGKDFSVFDSSTAERVQKVVKDTERELEKKVSKINFCFPTGSVKKIDGGSQNIIHPKKAVSVGEKHIEAAIKQARLLSVDWNLRCLHSFPVGFKLDKKFFSKPPLGIYGRKLEVQAVFYVCEEELILNIDSFFQSLGKDYSRLVLHPLAEVSAFREKDLEEGNFIFLNFGRKGVEISCFRDFILVDVVKLPFGGDFISENLAQSLGISFELAENIKVSYGSLEQEDSESEKTVMLKRSFSYEEVKLRDINSVLTSSYDKSFEDIRKFLTDSKLESKIDFIVACGGGVKIKGFKKKIEQYLKNTLKNPPSFIDKEVKERNRFLSAYGALRFPLSKINLEQSYKLPKSLLRRVVNIWEEYF